MDEIIDSKIYNQFIAHLLHNQGIEMTPDEVIKDRRAAYKTIRDELGAQGYALPVSDEELTILIQQALNR